MAKATSKTSAENPDKATKTSYMVRPSLNKKMKYICLQDGGTPSDLINQGMSEFVAKWEKKNGPIPIK